MKRLVFRIITDDATRLAMLKRGEVDIAMSLSGALAAEARRTSGVTIKPVPVPASFWLVLARAALGNAATRLEAFMAAGGMFTYGS